MHAAVALRSDAAALDVLLSFHTLAAGTYPLSLSGAHFLQQLFKVDAAGGSLGRDYYRDFYADSFEGGQVRFVVRSSLRIAAVGRCGLYVQG